MDRMSVNGLLKPTTGERITDQYLGHFLKIRYRQEIEGRPVYGEDRVDVEEDGKFRFFLPPKELLSGESVRVEVYAPDGELLGRQIYSFESLHAADIPENVPDDTEPFSIEVDPKIVRFNPSGPVSGISRGISGKVVDISGRNRVSGLQVVIVAGDDPDVSSENRNGRPVFAARTNEKGVFFGRIDDVTYRWAYGMIAGLNDEPIRIDLEEGKIPKKLLLLADLSELPPEAVSTVPEVPALPDAAELVGNASFSQDIGGKCVDFTIPNRALEEYSFYHTVRTTEPEIRGSTLTSPESSRLKTELATLSEDLFSTLDRLNASMGTLNLITFSVEEERHVRSGSSPRRAAEKPVGKKTTSESVPTPFSTYRLRLETGTERLKFDTSQLKYRFDDLLKLLAEQSRKKAELQRLHHELAVAYCGKEGVSPAATYCETLRRRDTLNRVTLEALLDSVGRHIGGDSNSETGDTTLSKELSLYVEATKKLIEEPYIDTLSLSIVRNRAETLFEIVDGDGKTEKSENLKALSARLRRLIDELGRSMEGGSSRFEPCPVEKTRTMGIMCIKERFEKIEERLRNEAVLSLGEILEIRTHYEIYLTSISTFLQLLERFHGFYQSGFDFSISLDDDYFVEHYDEIRASLSALKRRIQEAVERIDAIERAYVSNHPGRRDLSVENGIDWDETPTIYENTTIAHGHILHFKQQWKADGYSLGDLLYSLPLAPCQEKRIAIVDWDRKERGGRTEELSVEEELSARLSHNRDISEIIDASLKEYIHASSHSEVGSTSGGVGFGFLGSVGGGLLGIGGGVSHSGASSDSSSDQDSVRNLSSALLNRLRDTVSQSAASIRTQRSTVIETVGQDETVSAETEIVKNNSHCHAITIEYFEILRHYAVEQTLVDVQECLFVPLPMSRFDHRKILRWKDTLRRAVYGRRLQRGFDAIERIVDDYANSDFPVGSYADEQIEEFRGHFSISFELKRPYIGKIEKQTKTEIVTETVKLGGWFPWHGGLMKFRWIREKPLTEAEKDAIFEADYAPDIVRNFIDTLDIHAIADDGSETCLDLDFTLISNYRRGRALRVNIASRKKQNLTRRAIKYLRIRANTKVHPSSKIVLRTLYLHYRTRHLDEAIVRDGNLDNDILDTVEIEMGFPPKIETKTDAALIYTPLSEKESRDPRKEDREAAAALVDFLNEHMEMAHKVIWSNMDSSRLFGLLDGYIAPNSGGRSVASVVENRISGIVGNNLVLKVVPGVRLDPVFRKVEDLLGFYRPLTPPDPFRISVPTKGVYAESVMGRCNSCEEIDESRHWRFEEVPCGTQATPLEPVSTASRRSEEGDLRAKGLSPSIIGMQNAPTAPLPTNMSTVFDLLGKGDAFRNMTGLAGTQANAIDALKTTSKSVTDLAGIAADLEKQAAMKKDVGKILNVIDELENGKKMAKEDADALRKKVVETMIGVSSDTGKRGERKGEERIPSKEILEKLTASAPTGTTRMKISESREDGSSTEVKWAWESPDYQLASYSMLSSRPSQWSWLKWIKRPSNEKALRELFVVNAKSLIGLDAGNRNDLKIWDEILGPVREGTWKFRLKKPFRCRGGRCQGVSTCGLVAEGIWRRMGVDLDSLYCPYVDATTIKRAKEYAERLKNGAWMTPGAGRRPKEGDWIYIAERKKKGYRREHVLTCIEWNGDRLVSVDGGQVGKSGLQAVKRKERVWKETKKRVRLGSREVIGWVDVSKLGYRGWECLVPIDYNEDGKRSNPAGTFFA